MRYIFYKFFVLRGLLASIFAGMAAYTIRFLVLKYSCIDLFDILSNQYESLIFYSGLGGYGGQKKFFLYKI